MLEMTYATMLFGLTMGPGFGIPLGASTLFIATAFVKSNRHYISQLVAGMAVGTIFGVAGYWAVTRPEDQRPLSWSVVPDVERRQLALCAEYRF